MRLLYIEHDEHAKESATHLFSKFFDHVIMAQDGKEGLSLYLRHHSTIDLIITTLNLPFMHGVELIEKIRKHNPDIAIIVLSELHEAHHFPKTVDCGVDGYLFKPLSLSQFGATLGKLLEKMSLKKEHAKKSLLLQQYENITNLSAIISKSDPQGRITYVNEQFCRISGYSEEELLGKNHNIIRHPDVPKSTFEELWHTIKEEKKTWQGIVKNRNKNGESYYVKTTIQPILNAHGDIEEYISLRHDVTAIMSDKKQLFDFLEANKLSVLILVQIEDYAILEKFYNKSSVEKIESAFYKALLYLMPSMCGFQKVYFLENGLYAFVIDRRTCQATREELYETLERFLANVKEYVVRIDGIEYDISVVCSYTYGVFKIFEDAKIGIDHAMASKKPIVYADGLNDIEYDNALRNIETLYMIKTAIDNQKIISYFQPIINNQTQEIEKYESLVRLVNEEGKLLSPACFLDVAKKGRYSNKITKIVLNNSFEALHKVPNASISINLSMQDIEQESILEHIHSLLQIYKKHAPRLIFEILESENMKDINAIKRFIQDVKAQGVKIAIDDFGTGYSNFERLLFFEPDILKIDGSLIKNIHTNEVNQNIVETIILFAKKQKLSTVAEYVENEIIYKMVRDMGIDYSQGYYFGKPKHL
ncbi:PAS domain S-box [Sulfurospirillum barnesii SES-3]|uniref:PAS domain S-box n=2 Tax=Sulfurospirillum barnesii TaxID=44674 RepID=I3XVZ2_SULBS|nr:PAS domain S-box [Sulfurospirillum barnesii SES-3]